MKIELAQTISIEGDITANLANAVQCLEDSTPDTDLIIFPETFLTGFAEPGFSTNRALEITDPAFDTLKQAVSRNNTAIALGFLERSDDNHCFNTNALITPEDGILTHYRKTHLWTDERALVMAGERMSCVKWRDQHIGLMICYDLEFPETARVLAGLGADLIVITNGNMDPYGLIHYHLARARAIENQCFVAMANRCGEGAGYTFAGGSAIFGPDGKCLIHLGRDEARASTTLDFTAIANARKKYSYLADRRFSLAADNGKDSSQATSYYK